MIKILVVILLLAGLAYGEGSSGGVKDVNSTIVNSPSDIGLGTVSGRSTVNKFGATGASGGFDKADGEVTIWDGADDGAAWELMRYQYSATANIDSVSSSDAGDVYLTTFEGLDASTNELIQTITLNGQTRVTFPTNFYRIFRGYNANGVVFAGHIIAYTNNSITAGVPDDNGSIRCVIGPDNQQTEMAVFTVARGKKLLIHSLYAYTAGASKSSDYIIRLYARKPGGVFLLKFRGVINDIATSSIIDQAYRMPLTFTEGTDIEMTVEIPSGTATAAGVTAGWSSELVDD